MMNYTGIAKLMLNDKDFLLEFRRLLVDIERLEYLFPAIDYGYIHVEIYRDMRLSLLITDYIQYFHNSQPHELASFLTHSAIKVLFGESTNTDVFVFDAFNTVYEKEYRNDE